MTEESSLSLLEDSAFMLPRRWYRGAHGIIYFDVTSFGTTGPEWTGLLEGGCHNIGPYARRVLNSRAFQSTNQVRTTIAILPAFDYHSHIPMMTTEKVISKANDYDFYRPATDTACLARLRLTGEDLSQMGLLGIVFMHEPVEGLLLGFNRFEGVFWGNEKKFWLSALRAQQEWCAGYIGFAFAASMQQVFHE